MRLKQPMLHVPLAVLQHNGNENLLSPERGTTGDTTTENTTATADNLHHTHATNDSYNTNCDNVLTLYNNGRTNHHDAVQRRRQQDTLQWCNTINTIQHHHQDTNNKSLGDDNNYHQQHQQQLNLHPRPVYNINNTLAASLRSGVAPPPNPQLPTKQSRAITNTTSSICSESSPDDSLLEYEEAQQSCSSVDTSPQDEDRGFDLSDSESLSDDGNLSGDNNHLQSRGIVNPNYPGFQHLAHTLDYTIKTCSDTDFTDDDLDLEQDTTKINTCDVNNINNNNNNEDIEYKIDSVNRLDSVENIQKVFYDKPKLNIPLEFELEKQNNCLDSTEEASGSNLGSDEDLEGNILHDSDQDSNENLNPLDVKLNITESISTADIIGDFGKEIEQEFGRIVAREIEQELEEAVEKLTVTNDLSPSALKYNIEPNSNEPFEKSDAIIVQTTEAAEPITVKEESAGEPAIAKELEEPLQFQQTLVKEMADIKVARVTSTEALTLKMNQPFSQIDYMNLKENVKVKTADAFLSEAREYLQELPSNQQLLPPHKEEISKVNLESEKMEIESIKKPEKLRRDSNRENEDYKVEKKMDIDDFEKFCKEDRTKDENEKEEDSTVPRKKEKIEANLVKRRRDSSQQIASLITIPRRELGGKHLANRRSVPAAREKKKVSPEILGGFDVYNIETAMPKIDLDAIESHLRAAREEERRRRTDREEIRRRLAMGSEDDYYNGCDRPGRKPSLQARLQSGMNLQICFMNETVSDTESPNSDTECSLAETKQHNSLPVKSYRTSSPINHHQKPTNQPRPISLPIGTTQPLLQPVTQPMTEADFFARQARLQTEARMALAQAKEMAHMQMEVERQRQKKSPITEMIRSSFEKVGIPFPEERRRVSRQILTEMNVAQLQVIVNDLHTQIETLNESLVRFLMNRDDLHMEQDSMLVDIEDLTRYLGAKEQTVKDQKISSQQNNNIPPPSPAPASPLSAINNTVKPRLHRIASLVKK